MYLVSEKSEGLFLRKRQNTVKAAIQEGRYYSNATRLYIPTGVSSLCYASRDIEVAIVMNQVESVPQAFYPCPVVTPLLTV